MIVPSLMVKVGVLLGASCAIGLGHALIHDPIKLRPDQPAGKPREAGGPKPVPFDTALQETINRMAEEPGEETGASGETPGVGEGPGPVPSVTPPRATGPKAPAIDPATLGVEINLSQARWIYEYEVRKGQAQFLDARPANEYLAGHVTNSMHVIPGNFRNGIPQKVKDFLDPSQRIVVYCSGGDCDASHQVATFMSAAGFDRVHIFVDGFDAWAGAHPGDVQKGPDPFEG